MGVFLGTNPAQSCIFNFVLLVFISISISSLFDVCDAGNSIEKFKLRPSLKLSYYYTSQDDSFDLPTFDAYDSSLLAPSPLAQPPINLIPNPPTSFPSPSPSPSPSPFGAPPLSELPSSGPSPPPSDPFGPHPGPTQPKGAPIHRPGREYAVWCVARPTVPETMLQRAMDYACGNGADCGSVNPKGPCFVPNTLVAHASYAFNSYWQRTKVAGGTCDFGGTAMLITDDPSFNGCNFIYS